MHQLHEKILIWYLKQCSPYMPAQAILLKRKLNLDPICPVCYSVSTSYLFTQCFITEKTWELAFQHKQLGSDIPSLGITLILTTQVWLKSIKMTTYITKSAPYVSSHFNPFKPHLDCYNHSHLKSTMSLLCPINRLTYKSF